MCVAIVVSEMCASVVMSVMIVIMVDVVEVLCSS